MTKSLLLMTLLGAVGSPTGIAQADPPAAATGVAPTAASAPTRLQLSQMIGMDVSRTLLTDPGIIDPDAFERAVRNALAGGPPLFPESDAVAVGQALMQRVRARTAGLPPGTPLPPVDRVKASLLIGTDVGNRLTPLKNDIDVAAMLAVVRDQLAGKPAPLNEADAARVRQHLVERMRLRAQAQATQNASAGAAFLARNRQQRGVVTTPSGLQYTILRPGSGARPRAQQSVRVNYRGTLLDGTEFDSSYKRNEPATFRLDQVIRGWTEGLALMPVGSKYRFWVPAALAYGSNGAPGSPIGPNATLVFEVELLDIL